MNKLLLEKYIRKSILKQLKEQEEETLRQERSIYVIYRYPYLKKVCTDLMSPAFARFIKNVEIIAPKPTTFRFELINGMDFYLIYNGKGKFTAKVEGKKYNLLNLGELQRASQTIANVLELNYNPVKNESAGSNELDTTGGGGGGNFPGGNASAGPDLNPQAELDPRSAGIKADLDAAESEINNPDASPSPQEDEPLPNNKPLQEVKKRGRKPKN